MRQAANKKDAPWRLFGGEIKINRQHMTRAILGSEVMHCRTEDRPHIGRRAAVVGAGGQRARPHFFIGNAVIADDADAVEIRASAPQRLPDWQIPRSRMMA